MKEKSGQRKWFFSPLQNANLSRLNFLKQFVKSSFGIAISCLIACSLTTSTVWNLFPFNDRSHRKSKLDDPMLEKKTLPETWRIHSVVCCECNTSISLQTVWPHRRVSVHREVPLIGCHVACPWDIKNYWLSSRQTLQTPIRTHTTRFEMKQVHNSTAC